MPMLEILLINLWCDTLSKSLRNPSKYSIVYNTAQSTQIKLVISVPIKDFIHHYPRALFNDIPSGGAQFNDIPGSQYIARSMH